MVVVVALVGDFELDPVTWVTMSASVAGIEHPDNFLACGLGVSVASGGAACTTGGLSVRVVRGGCCAPLLFEAPSVRWYVVCCHDGGLQEAW